MKDKLLTIHDKINQAVAIDLNRRPPDVIAARAGLQDAQSILDGLIRGIRAEVAAKPEPVKDHPRARTVRKMKAAEDGDDLL